MKISYAINNLRSLDEMEPVELRPITILVGANSSGKSTFLRSISLLRQSLLEITDEPILWYGRHVDFGDFLKSVREKNLDNEISFEFGLKDIQILEIDPLSVSVDSDLIFEEKIIDDVKYKISIKNNGKKTFVNSFFIKISKYDLCFRIVNFDGNNECSCYINDKLLDNFFLSNLFVNINNIFLPFEFIPKSFPGEIDPAYISFIARSDSQCLFTQNIHDLIYKFFNEKPYSHEAINEAVKIVNSYPFNKQSLEILNNHSKSNNTKMLYQFLLNGENKGILDEIKINCTLSLIGRICERISLNLQKFFVSSTHLGPSRDLNRSYRYQGLDVSELSADSRNFPMFLKRLKDKNELSEFSNWARKFIGYEIEIIEELEHFFINLRQDGLSVNVTDTGYGLSQILPILALIWMHTIRKIKNDDQRNGKSNQLQKNTIAMEQPELHLHPKLQAKVADALVSALNHNKSSAERPMLIVETHSEPLISRLGELIEKGKVSEKDVQVVLFSKRDNKPNSTEVKTATFNNIGALSNWPYGFFNY